MATTTQIEPQLVHLPPPEVVKTNVTMPMAVPVLPIMKPTINNDSPIPYGMSASSCSSDSCSKNSESKSSCKSCESCGSSSCSGSCKSQSSCSSASSKSSCQSCKSDSCSGGCKSQSSSYSSDSSCSSVSSKSSCDSCKSESCSGCKGGDHSKSGSSSGGGNRPLQPSNCHNRTIYVDEKCGSDNKSYKPYNNGTVYKTLNFAIAQSSNGDTLRLAPGVYPLGSVKDKTLSIIGSGPTTEILLGGNLKDMQPTVIDHSDLNIQDSSVNYVNKVELVNGSKVRVRRNTFRSEGTVYVDATSYYGFYNNEGVAASLPLADVNVYGKGTIANNRIKTEQAGSLYVGSVDQLTNGVYEYGPHEINNNYIESSGNFKIFEAQVASNIEIDGLTDKVTVYVTENDISVNNGDVVLFDTSKVGGADAIVKAVVANNIVKYKGIKPSGDATAVAATDALDLTSSNNVIGKDGLVYDKDASGNFLADTDQIVSNTAIYEGKVIYRLAQKITRENQDIDYRAAKVFFYGSFDKIYTLPSVDAIPISGDLQPSRDIKLINKGDGCIQFRYQRHGTVHDSPDSENRSGKHWDTFCLGAYSVMELSTLDGQWVDTTDTD